MEAKGDKGKGSKGGKGGRRDGAAIGELLPETNEEVKKEYENEFDVTAANSKFDKAAVATEGEEGGPVELSDGSGWLQGAFRVDFRWFPLDFPIFSSIFEASRWIWMDFLLDFSRRFAEAAAGLRQDEVLLRQHLLRGDGAIGCGGPAQSRVPKVRTPSKIDPKLLCPPVFPSEQQAWSRF